MKTPLFWLESPGCANSGPRTRGHWHLRGPETFSSQRDSQDYCSAVTRGPSTCVPSESRACTCPHTSRPSLALASFLLFCISPDRDAGPQATSRSPTTGIRIHGCPHRSSGHPSWAVSRSAGYSVDGTGYRLTREAEEGVMVLRPVRPESKPDQGVGHPFPTATPYQATQTLVASSPFPGQRLCHFYSTSYAREV